LGCCQKLYQRSSMSRPRAQSGSSLGSVSPPRERLSRGSNASSGGDQDSETELPLKLHRCSGRLSPIQLEQEYVQTQFESSFVWSLMYTALTFWIPVTVYYIFDREEFGEFSHELLWQGIFNPICRFVMRVVAHRMHDQRRARLWFGIGHCISSLITGFMCVYGVRSGLPTHLGRSPLGISSLCLLLLLRQIFLRLSGFPHQCRYVLVALTLSNALLAAPASPAASVLKGVAGMGGEGPPSGRTALSRDALDRCAITVSVFTGEMAGLMLDMLARKAHLRSVREATSLKRRMEQVRPPALAPGACTPLTSPTRGGVQAAMACTDLALCPSSPAFA
jgi:hypothetical protein